MPNICPTIAAAQQPHTQSVLVLLLWQCFGKLTNQTCVPAVQKPQDVQKCSGRVISLSNNILLFQQINSKSISWPCVTAAVIDTKPVAIIFPRPLAVMLTSPVTVTVARPATVTIAGPGVATQVQVDADGRCKVPVQAPQPVVLAQVTAAMRGATPQQVMVAIMKYRKFRSMLACTTPATILLKKTASLFRTSFTSTSDSMVYMHPCLETMLSYVQAPGGTAASAERASTPCNVIASCE